MRDFPQRRNVQTGIVGQLCGARGQRTGQTDNMVIRHAPGTDNHHRRTQLMLKMRQAVFIQIAPIQKPAGTASAVVQRHHFIATERKR